MCFDQHSATGNKAKKGGKLAPAAVPSRGALPDKAKGTTGKIVNEGRPCDVLVGYMIKK